MRGYVLFLTMIADAAAMAQVAPNASGSQSTIRMATPPPISGVQYSNEVGTESRSNYLRTDITYGSSYIDNLYADTGSTSIAETTLSVLPKISLDSITARQHMMMSYSPGFTFYRPSGVLNEIDNTAAANYNLRLTKYTTLSVIENFNDSSSPFFPANTETGGIVSGTPESYTPGIIPPFAKRLSNSISTEITAQTSMNVMIGVSALSTILRYPNSSQTPGLYNSSSRGGTGFYNVRISHAQYVGATYQYLDMLAYPPGGESVTSTSTGMAYYTIYPKEQLSISMSGGLQRYRITGTQQPALGAWAPSIGASMGWQGPHTSFAASYSQSVTGGGGIIGAYHSRMVNAAARWRMAKTWTTEAAVMYASNHSVSALLATEALNGNSVAASLTAQRAMGNRISLSFSYDRVYQNHDGIAILSANPNTDRVSVAILWNFLRPFGR